MNELAIWRPRRNTITQMDALQFAWQIEPRTVQTVITSPPYWGLRDYGVPGQWGSEPTIQAHIDRIVELFRAIREALRDDGTVWLNYGDAYASTANGRSAADTKLAGNDDRTFRDKPFSTVVDGLKPKDLIGMPWRVALALQADGWYLRSAITWHKPNPMPESVTDRPTKAHEYIFLLAKSERYYYDADAIRETASDSTLIRWNGVPQRKNPSSQGLNVAGGTGENTFGLNPDGRNARTVWTIPTQPFPGAHFAVFPEALIKPCVLAGAPLKSCAVCGAPYVRDVDIERNNYKSFDHPLRTGGAISGGVGRNFPDTTRNTTGFSPSCTCNAETRPGLVYDPFMGAGTTAVVAKSHGRDFIGSEINAEYIQLANARLDGSIKRLVAEKNAQSLDDLPLFKELNRED